MLNIRIKHVKLNTSDLEVTIYTDYINFYDGNTCIATYDRKKNRFTSSSCSSGFYFQMLQDALENELKIYTDELYNLIA
jgi:hypothetical protein